MSVRPGFQPPGPGIGEFIQLSLQGKTTDRFTPMLLTRLSHERINPSESWPKVETLHASLGPRLGLSLTSVISLVAGATINYRLAEKISPPPFRISEVQRHVIDPRAEIGIKGQLGKISVSMVGEKSLFFEAGSIQLQLPPEGTFLPRYSNFLLRFSLGYTFISPSKQPEFD